MKITVGSTVSPKKYYDYRNSWNLINWADSIHNHDNEHVLVWVISMHFCIF